MGLEVCALGWCVMVVVVGVVFMLVFEVGVVAVEVPWSLILVFNPPLVGLSSPGWVVHIILSPTLEHS